LYVEKNVNLKAMKAINKYHGTHLCSKYGPGGSSSCWNKHYWSISQTVSANFSIIQPFHYYHPSIGAHESTWIIRARWSSLSWERSFLCVSQKMKLLLPVSRSTIHFQWAFIWAQAQRWWGSPDPRGKFECWMQSFLGFHWLMRAPAQMSSRYNHFQRGSIYWVHTEHLVMDWFDHTGFLRMEQVFLLSNFR